MDSGHSQSPKLTCLSKSFPLTSQQQPRLNYKRRVYSAHTKGVPRVPSLGDSRGCTLQDTYYIRSHYQDKESKQLYQICRNKHREAVKMRRQRNMAQMKEQIKTPEKELNKTKISNLLDAEFETLVIRMLKEHCEDLSSMKKTSQKYRTH